MEAREIVGAPWPLIEPLWGELGRRPAVCMPDEGWTSLEGAWIALTACNVPRRADEVLGD